VTGASGLLGSWMTQELVARGANVVVLLRDWVPASRLVTSGVIDRVTAVRGELEDLELLLRALNEHEIDTVFHLGAQTIVGTASRSPLSTFEANIRGTWNLLEACRLNPKLLRRVLVASSDKAYGEHAVLPYQEDAPLQGKWPYDVSKSCTDLITLSYWHTYRLPVAVTRCGNLFGGGDLNFNRLIPGTIRAALQGERPVIRSDGTFVRVYLHVRDAVDAYLQLAERMDDPRFHGQAFNFGKAGLEPLIMNEASHEIPKQYLDCTKARTFMNWRPAFTLEQGLDEAIAWYTEWLRQRSEHTVP